MFFGKRTPQVFGEAFLKAATSSRVWDGAWVWSEPSVPSRRVIPPFKGWVASCLTQQVGLWVFPSPSGLLQKAAAGQRLPSDLHNCTVS